MAAAATQSHLVHHLLHHHPTPPSSSSPSLFSVFLKPLLLVSTISFNSSNQRLLKPHSYRSVSNCNSTQFSSLPRFSSRPLLSLTLPHRHFTNASHLSISVPLEKEEEEEEEEEAAAQELEDEDFHDEDDDEMEIELKGEKLDSGEAPNMGLDSLSSKGNGNGLKLPNLTVKEKKELASYAHSLGKKLKSQLVGKSGVTANVATSFVENLESNELLKIKIHGTCPGELEDVVKQLEEATGSVVVGQIGRTVILYRPSLTKLQAEEKRRQVRKLYVRRKLTDKPILPGKGARPRPSGHGRRGSSRFESPSRG